LHPTFVSLSPFCATYVTLVETLFAISENYVSFLQLFYIFFLIGSLMIQLIILNFEKQNGTRKYKPGLDNSFGSAGHIRNRLGIRGQVKVTFML
jgi:hypothetical protein